MNDLVRVYHLSNEDGHEIVASDNADDVLDALVLHWDDGGVGAMVVTMRYVPRAEYARLYGLEHPNAVLTQPVARWYELTSNSSV